MFARPPIPEVRARDVAADACLVDVREEDEWRAGHAPGARHLPMTQLPARIDELPDDGELLIVCRSGHRSAEVVGYLLGHGYGQVRNVADGMLGWAAAGRPMVSEDGDPPTVL